MPAIQVDLMNFCRKQRIVCSRTHLLFTDGLDSVILAKCGNRFRDRATRGGSPEMMEVNVG